MSIHEIIRKHAVKINEGSGVLVHCLCDDFSYILTAKHVLKKENQVEDWEGKPHQILEIYFHDDDCALLKIPPVGDLPLTRFKNNTFNYNTKGIFAGFPGYRSKDPNAAERFKTYDGNVKQTNEGFLLELDERPPKKFIDGASGGGVYIIEKGKPYLIGIEIRMSGPQPEEPGIVFCYDLQKFDEIVCENSLPPILPSFLSCFSMISPSIFHYTLNSELLITKLRNILDRETKKLIANGIPKPYEILELYDNSLIVKGQDDSAIYDLELWSTYAEFLVLHSLLNNIKQIDLNYLKSIEKKIRFVYSRDKEGWLLDLNNILYSARRLLDNGGILVVSSGDTGSLPVPDKALLKYLVENISIPIAEYDEDDGARIDMGFESGEIPFSLALLGGLHRECVTRNESVLLITESSQLLKYLTGKYADEFNKCK
ncbi:TPA: trypsin-like peptidase domain-containing protein [Enterobacter hormaechei]|nr:trypsin-like peptidase domain-containing protein [Enterobacter hormaechei]